MNIRKIRIEPGAVMLVPLSALSGTRDIEVEDGAILVIYTEHHSVEDIRQMLEEARRT